ncbi:MAG: hypothetical protein QHH74_15865, partial [Spirochaetota bacterium]|nr:hypothetical protein [Spirochaetota bacterium]
GNYDTPGYAQGVAVVGSYAYVADNDTGLQIIDITDPAHPESAGSYNTSSFANAVAVSRGYAFVADFESGLQIIRIPYGE